MNLRQKIEGLARWTEHGSGLYQSTAGELVFRSDVLRIIDEHEQGLNESKHVPAWYCPPCNLEVELGETFGSCPKCGKPMEANERKGGDSHSPEERRDIRRTPDGSNVTSPPVGQAGGDEFMPGLPDEALRKAWPEWDTIWTQSTDPAQRNATLTFSSEGTKYTCSTWQIKTSWATDNVYSWGKTMFRPRGKTWAQVEGIAEKLAKKSLCGNCNEPEECGCEQAKCNGCSGVVWLKTDGTGACPKCNAWRIELAEFRKAGKPGPLSKPMWPLLESLDALRLVIESGKGEAIMPDGVAKCMPIEGGGHHPAGIWEPWMDRGDWICRDRSNGMYSADAEYILCAINQYGNGLCKP